MIILENIYKTLLKYKIVKLIYNKCKLIKNNEYKKLIKIYKNLSLIYLIEIKHIQKNINYNNKLKKL